MHQLFKFMILAALAVTGVARADNAQLLSQVSRMLSTPDGLQVSFSQSKKISGFNSSVNSSGKVKIAKAKGLLWMTEKPYQSVLKVTPNGISESRGGSSTFSMSSAQEPKIKAVGTILTSLMSGNFAPLQRYFQISGNATSSSWTMNLSPIDGGVRQAISAVTVSGGRYVNSVNIKEANGDATQIRFSSPVTLSAGQIGL